jgi:hypothetical protein
MSSKPTASLAIFKAGTHTSVDGRTLTFSEADIQAIADTYDPALSEAPLVVGHPDSLEAPAYGWAKSLRAHDGVLYAEPHQVEAQFAELVNAGRMKKISASIYLADTPGNPTPGKPYLRHIGFLGAKAPAVKGLPPARFSAGDQGTVEFAQPLEPLGWTLTSLFQGLRDWLIDKEGLETANQVIPQWSIASVGDYTRNRSDEVIASASYAAPDTNPEIIPVSQQNNAADFAAREQQLATDRQELERREQALAEREGKARRDDAAAFAESLVKDGKLLPRHQAAIVELLLVQPAASTPLSFAEGETTVSKPAGDVLRELLTSLPKQVDYAEKSYDQPGGVVANFAAPVGTTVGASDAALYAKAKAYQQQHPKASWIEAVTAVGG